jgi:hypothetical protein
LRNAETTIHGYLIIHTYHATAAAAVAGIKNRFMLMFQYAICNTFSFRERRRFYDSLASPTLLWTCIAESIAMLIVCSLGIPGVITSCPVGAVFMAFGAAIILVFGVNDVIKYKLLTYFGVH